MPTEVVEVLLAAMVTQDLLYSSYFNHWFVSGIDGINRHLYRQNEEILPSENSNTSRARLFAPGFTRHIGILYELQVVCII